MSVSGVSAVSSIGAMGTSFVSGVASVPQATGNFGVVAYTNMPLVPYVREGLAMGPPMTAPRGFFLGTHHGDAEHARNFRGLGCSDGQNGDGIKGGIGHAVGSGAVGGGSGTPSSGQPGQLRARLKILEGRLKRFDLSFVPAKDRYILRDAGKAISRLEVHYTEVRDIFSFRYLGDPAWIYGRFKDLLETAASGRKTIFIRESSMACPIESLLRYFQNSIHTRRDLRLMQYYFLASSVKAVRMQIAMLKERRLVLAGIWKGFEDEVTGKISHIDEFLAGGAEIIDDRRDLLSSLDFEIRTWLVGLADYIIAGTEGPLGIHTSLSQAVPPSDNYMKALDLLSAIGEAETNMGRAFYNGRNMTLDELKDELYCNYEHLMRHLITLKYLFGAVVIRSSMAGNDDGKRGPWDAVAGDMKSRMTLIDAAIKHISPSAN